MNVRFKSAVRLVIVPGLLAASLAAFALPLFQLNLDDRVFRPAGWRLLFSAISFQGQAIQYPLALKLVLAGILLALAATAALTLTRRLRAAALTACLATGLTLMTLMVISSLEAKFISLGASQTGLSLQIGFIILAVLPFVAALLLLWSRGGEIFVRSLFLASAAVSVAAVGMITLYMLIAGLPGIIEVGPLKFLFGTVWKPTDAANPQFGILPMILATLAGTAGAILIGVPIGLMTAVFLAETAPKRLARLIRPAVELLAGIPSVIYGFFGLQLLVPLVQKVFNLPSGATLFSAILILAVMILPTIVSTAETGLRAVPDIYREASLALGATRVETIFKVTIPAARSAILSGVILGVGRAIGETMAVIMVAGNISKLPALFGPVRPMTVGIALEMSYASGLHQQALFAIGLILFAFIMVVNLAFSWISRQGVQMDAQK
jgi:phosphate ABC transporter permease protein PstC